MAPRFPSPNEAERVEREQREQRRKQRLQQVRAQQRQVARSIREQSDNKRAQQRAKEASKQQVQEQAQLREEQAELQKLYATSLGAYGQAHAAAEALESLNLDEQREQAARKAHRKAQARGSKAMQAAAEQRIAKERQAKDRAFRRQVALEAAWQREDKAVQRQRDAEMRASQVSENKVAMPQPRANNYAHTYFHRSKPTTTYAVREPVVEGPSAVDDAEAKNEQLVQLHQNQAESRRQSTLRAARRGAAAAKQVRLETARRELEQELKTLERVELQRRKQSIARPSKHVVQPLERKQKQLSKQAKLAQAFEHKFLAQAPDEAPMLAMPLASDSGSSPPPELGTQSPSSDTEQSGGSSDPPIVAKAHQAWPGPCAASEDTSDTDFVQSPLPHKPVADNELELSFAQCDNTSSPPSSTPPLPTAAVPYEQPPAQTTPLERLMGRIQAQQRERENADGCCGDVTDLCFSTTDGQQTGHSPAAFESSIATHQSLDDRWRNMFFGADRVSDNKVPAYHTTPSTTASAASSLTTASAESRRPPSLETTTVDHGCQTELAGISNMIASHGVDRTSFRSSNSSPPTTDRGKRHSENLGQVDQHPNSLCSTTREDTSDDIEASREDPEIRRLQRRLARLEDMINQVPHALGRAPAVDTLHRPSHTSKPLACDDTAPRPGKMYPLTMAYNDPCLVEPEDEAQGVALGKLRQSRSLYVGHSSIKRAIPGTVRQPTTPSELQSMSVDELLVASRSVTSSCDQDYGAKDYFVSRTHEAHTKRDLADIQPVWKPGADDDKVQQAFRRHKQAYLQDSRERLDNLMARTRLQNPSCLEHPATALARQRQAERERQQQTAADTNAW
eukprot:m.499357 g.499357  ORF g.499357 m.499357 type:complete len:850 (-) comp57174_c0_seq1:93-2642(-)